ncbi:MAG: apolipoprotein N-acyltransferase [Planctomycetota bacterium]|nr:apolipoprotein N-acyltransferase [Planctomycetota bacterium]
MQASDTGAAGIQLNRIDRLHVTWLLLLLSVLGWWVAFPPVGAWPLILLSAWALIRAAVGARTTGHLLLATGVLFTLLWLWIQRWTADVSGPGYPVLAVYMAGWMCLMAWLLRRFARDRFYRNWPMACTAPVVVVAVEYLRGCVVFDGYPWYFFGHPLIDAPALIQFADTVGSWWGSILVATVAGSLYDIWSRSPRSSASAWIATGVLLFSVLYGGWRLGQESTVPGPSVVGIQTNLPQDNKVGWSWSAQQQDVAGFIEMTMQAAREDIELVVWPETMVPGLGFEPDTAASILEAGGGFDYLVHWPGAMRALARSLDRPLLVGSPTWLGLEVVERDGVRQLEAERRYNSAVLLEPDGGIERYDKVALTPFGEFMPYVEHWPWLEERLLSFGAGGMSFNLLRGDEVGPLHLHRRDGTSLGIATPICFEDTVASLCRRLVYVDGVKRAQLMVNISNDGWFGTDAAARITHGMVARFRCIENRVPLLRVVNTGQTALFDSCGRTVVMLPMFEPSWLPVVPQLDERTTIYGAWFGDSIAGGLLLLCLLNLLWTMLPRIRESK